ncbi:hypothetical protein [Thalassospira lohafexi]|uniref:Uncharacterized protein n=1 Tax=Thalassospira lohafexi TaxID=744227 RepID=A0A2N3L3S5_9PROT|nr:hypothetical protein [Thalassospira lohafexi]PKR57489.1 hypothetical protein COO92_16235 [Thalassospira lohafexi]
MIKDMPGVTPYARTVLLVSLTINSTIFLVTWSASLSAQGAAAFLLAFSIYGMMAPAMLNFFFIATLAFAYKAAKKPLDNSVKVIAFVLTMWGCTNATFTTRGYLGIALAQDRNQTDKCATQMLRENTIKDRLKYSISSYFLTADFKKTCGLERQK